MKVLTKKENPMTGQLTIQPDLPTDGRRLVGRHQSLSTPYILVSTGSLLGKVLLPDIYLFVQITFFLVSRENLYER